MSLRDNQEQTNKASPDQGQFTQLLGTFFRTQLSAGWAQRTMSEFWTRIVFAHLKGKMNCNDKKPSDRRREMAQAGEDQSRQTAGNAAVRMQEWERGSPLWETGDHRRKGSHAIMTKCFPRLFLTDTLHVIWKHKGKQRCYSGTVRILCSGTHLSY